MSVYVCMCTGVHVSVSGPRIGAFTVSEIYTEIREPHKFTFFHFETQKQKRKKLKNKNNLHWDFTVKGAGQGGGGGALSPLHNLMTSGHQWRERERIIVTG